LDAVTAESVNRPEIQKFPPERLDFLWRAFAVCEREADRANERETRNGHRMNLSDVWRADNEMIEMFGNDAPIRAAMQADAALDVGDTADYQFWKRVVTSINDLGRPPSAHESKN
jgi:hypothetical protein